MFALSLALLLTPLVIISGLTKEWLFSFQGCYFCWEINLNIRTETNTKNRIKSVKEKKENEKPKSTKWKEIKTKTKTEMVGGPFGLPYKHGYWRKYDYVKQLIKCKKKSVDRQRE